MTTSLLPEHSDSAPEPLPTLSELVADSRCSKQPVTSQLESYRDELLKLRRAGESVAAIGMGLRRFGVTISDEALRLWLNRELGHKPIKRRRWRARPSPTAPELHGTDAAQAETVATVTTTSSTGNDGRVTAIHPAPAAKDGLPAKPSSLILPGETPMEALNRRLAAMRAARQSELGAN